MSRCQIKPTRGRQRNRLKRRCLQMRKRPLRIQRKRKKEKWPHQRKKALFSSGSGKYLAYQAYVSLFLPISSPSWSITLQCCQQLGDKQFWKGGKQSIPRICSCTRLWRYPKICKSKDLGVLNDQIMVCSLFSSICCSSTVSLWLF